MESGPARTPIVSVWAETVAPNMAAISPARASCLLCLKMTFIKYSCFVTVALNNRAKASLFYKTITHGFHFDLIPFY
jgi:hypothetical protein